MLARLLRRGDYRVISRMRVASSIPRVCDILPCMNSSIAFFVIMHADLIGFWKHWYMHIQLLHWYRCQHATLTNQECYQLMLSKHLTIYSLNIQLQSLNQVWHVAMFICNSLTIGTVSISCLERKLLTGNIPIVVSYQGMKWAIEVKVRFLPRVVLINGN